MKDGLNKWKDIHIHLLEDSIIKLAILPKLMYSANPNSITITAGLCVEIDKLVPTFVEKYK